MKVLWLVSITIPAAAEACGLRAGEVSGGWLTGQLHALTNRPDAPFLTVCSVDSRAKTALTGGKGGVRYRILPDGERDTFAMLLRAEKPDLVHIWGTEYPAAAAMHQAALGLGIPALVGIQGVMRDCAAHLCDGVPARYLHSGPVQKLIDRAVPGALLDKMQARFDGLARAEADLLRQARYVTGRTGFDRAAMADLAPDARYFACNETLRPAFYTEPLWQPRTFGTAPVLLLTQGNYPLKNLHTLLLALPALLRRWPGLVLRVAGWGPLDKGALLRPVIEAMFPYQTWCARLIKENGLQHHVQYTGPLQEAEMRQAYLDADVFVLPSYCENSPNSLGEAMLLGLPCAAARAGGIPSMMGEEEGMLYGPPGDAQNLSNALAALLSDPGRAAALGQAARRRALATHDPAANAGTLLAIYRTITGEESLWACRPSPSSSPATAARPPCAVRWTACWTARRKTCSCCWWMTAAPMPPPPCATPWPGRTGASPPCTGKTAGLPPPGTPGWRPLPGNGSCLWTRTTSCCPGCGRRCRPPWPPAPPWFFSAWSGPAAPPPAPWRRGCMNA